MKMLKWCGALAAAVAVGMIASLAVADYTILDSTGTTKTVKAFVCETTKICTAHVPMASDGTEIFTSSAAGYVRFASAPAVTATNATAGSFNATVVGTGTFATQAAATQSGTWTVQPGNTANTTAWLVTGTGGAFPGTHASGSVASGAFASGSIASGALASGSVSSGAFASGSVSSGAFASGALAAGSMVDLLTMRGTKAAGTAAANSALVGGVYNSGGVTLTDGQQAAAQFTAAGDLKVSGVGVAQGSTTSGQTLSPIGCRTLNAPPADTTAQTNIPWCDLSGRIVTAPYTNPENMVSGGTAAMTGTTSTSLMAAPASGLRNYMTHLICTNSHATVGTFVLVQDGSGGTTIYEGYAAAVGGGFSITLPVPLRQPTTATALYVQDVTTGANVICFGSGYKAA